MTEASRALQDLEAIDRVIADFTARRRELAKRVGNEVAQALLAPFFEYPVQAVAWNQYTPGYCDGDPCTFQVSYPGIQFPGYDEEDEEHEDGPGYVNYDLKRLLDVDPREPVPDYYKHDPQHWYNYVARQEERRDRITALGVTRETLNALADLWETLHNWLEAHEDFLEDAFGDPVTVTFRADGSVEVDEYYVGY